jgi:hypothetical protein
MVLFPLPPLFLREFDLRRYMVHTLSSGRLWMEGPSPIPFKKEWLFPGESGVLHRFKDLN